MSYIGADHVFNRPVFRFKARMMTSRVGKTLFSDFEEESDTPSDDAIKVFLRLKPTNYGNDTITVLDSKTVLFKMPPESTQARKKLNMPDQFKYVFSNIFQPQVTQADIYTGCVANHIKDLFAGQHCLLFTYGTTNAGKTFTVLGTGDHPGIIPRTLTTVFKSIRGKEYHNARITPYMFNSALEVTDADLQEELNFKNKILTWNPEKTQLEHNHSCKSQSTIQSSIDEIIGESVFREMQKRLTNDTSIIEYESDPEDRFSVWISFAEIYNESIYDLLQPLPLNGKRKPLRLAQDKKKNTYVKDLKHVFVETEEEAYKILMFGKTNLHVAATGMNSRSSRSHCIFTIKLLRCPNVEHPERVVVSSFSICDLAGAERQKKTLNEGMRLKESQNINCSLHVLSRCFSIIRENQMSNQPNVLIPFRDSKLTQLFQHALLGKESVTMIVNVNSDQDLWEETQHVLKASAIAKHIVVQPRIVKRPARVTRTSIFSQFVTKHNRSTLIRWDSCVKQKAPGAQSVRGSEVSEEDHKSEIEEKEKQYEELLALVETLREKLKEEKTKHLETKKNQRQLEERIQKEMRAEFEVILNKAKQQNALDGKRVQDIEEGRTKGLRVIDTIECNRDKKPRKEVDTNDEEDFELKDLREEIRIQQKQIEGLTDLINILKEEKKQQAMEITSAQMKLAWKERDIQNIKKKLELFGEEGGLHAEYLALEKKMESDIKERDDLLDEARMDMLEEIRMREESEEELAKLEKELTEKEEEIYTLRSKIEEQNRDIDGKINTIDLLNDHIDDIKMEFDEEIREVERRCTQLEFELAEERAENEKLKAQIALMMNESPESEQHLIEVSSLNLEIKKLQCVEMIMAEKLYAQLEKFRTYKEEFEAVIEALLEEKNTMQIEFDRELTQLMHDLRIKKETICDRDNEIALLKKDMLFNLNEETDRVDEQCDEKMVELIEKMSEEHDFEMKNLKEKFDLERDKIKKETLELKQQLDIELNLNASLKQDLESAKQTVHQLKQTVDKNSSEIEKLQQVVESYSLRKEEEENRHNSEVSILEKNLKQQIQETTRLLDLQNEKSKENVRLINELSKAKATLDELRLLLKDKENKIMGLESSLPALQTLQDEFEKQRKVEFEYKQRCEDQVATIFNMEQEVNSFKLNQKEIIGKYEDQLKKTKEENETLKKEIARITSAFFKSTPTPKKELENQVEQLKKQLEEALTTKSKELIEEKEVHSKVRFDPNGPNKENEFNFEDVIPDATSMLKLRARALSTGQNYEPKTQDPSNRSKSASKVRTRRTARIQNLQSSTMTDCEKETEQGERLHRQPRKKLLWNTDNQDHSVQLDDDIDLTIPQDSPGTYVKRNLRSRKK